MLMQVQRVFLERGMPAGKETGVAEELAQFSFWALNVGWVVLSRTSASMCNHMVNL